MKKQIKLQTEYSITIPLWYGDGWEGKVGPMEKLEWKKAKDNFTVKTYKNSEGVLPQNITYMEWYIFENESGVLPGSQRLITDDLGNIYYTVTHYNEALLANFIKLQ